MGLIFNPAGKIQKNKKFKKIKDKRISIFLVLYFLLLYYPSKEKLENNKKSEI